MTADRTAGWSGTATPGMFDEVHRCLDAAWALLPHGPQERALFDTAVAEVAANILQHTAAHLPVDVRFLVTITPERAHARFTDTGAPAPPGVNATALPGPAAESGRGLALARAAVDSVTYARTAGVNHWDVIAARRPA
ncbi:ATP-binding protein [Streptomyces sp. NPDC047000]|uniref:ATP-binding protein n=1 Tax=Streptomyces sp. NPDC047000 TaxID=3155474 RepID=UPI0033FE2C7B